MTAKSMLTFSAFSYSARKTSSPRRRVPGGGDALDGRVQLGLAGFEFAQDRRGLPDEDAAVPEVFAAGDELLGRRRRRASP